MAWIRVEKTLRKILPKPLTPFEKALGLQPSNKKEEKPILLRNWVTFSVRHTILLEERRAYRRKSIPKANVFFQQLQLTNSGRIKHEKTSK